MGGEREEFIYNQIDGSRSVSTTPLSGDTASGHSWSSMWRRVLYPHSPFGLVARLSATHKRAQTVSDPPQSPTRSLEGSGSQTDPLTPWYNVRARIIPFRYSPDLRGERCRDRAETKETHPFHECYVFLKIALRKIEIALKKKSEKKRRNHFMSAMFFRLSASCIHVTLLAA